jgi:hypothetical protein
MKFRWNAPDSAGFSDGGEPVRCRNLPFKYSGDSPARPWPDGIVSAVFPPLVNAISDFGRAVSDNAILQTSCGASGHIP